MDREEIRGAALVWALVFSACVVSTLGSMWVFNRYFLPAPVSSPVTNPVEAYVVSDEPYVIPDPCGLDVVLCPGESGYEQKLLESKIRTAAYAAGVDADVAVAIAQCESSLVTTSVNATSGARGLYQFLPSTWAWIGNPGDPFDEDDAIAAFMEQYPKHPDWWVCE